MDIQICWVFGFIHLIETKSFNRLFDTADYLQPSGKESLLQFLHFFKVSFMADLRSACPAAKLQYLERREGLECNFEMNNNWENNLNKHWIAQHYDLHNHEKCHFTASRVGASGQSGMQGGKLTSEFSAPLSTGTEQSNALRLSSSENMCKDRKKISFCPQSSNLLQSLSITNLGNEHFQLNLAFVCQGNRSHPNTCQDIPDTPQIPNRHPEDTL